MGQVGMYSYVHIGTPLPVPPTNSTRTTYRYLRSME